MLLTKFGNTPKNQEIKILPRGRLFVSYKKAIALITDTGEVCLDSQYWCVSVTTGTYRNQFLGEGIQETRKQISLGKYHMKDLQFLLSK